MECKYFVTDCTNPYRNLAQEQGLMKYVSKGTCILFLWQNEDTIVIGRNQDVYKECKVEEFLHMGGKLARRRSGGGAVFHDLGNLNFSIICNETDLNRCGYHSLVRKALTEFGIKTNFNGRNDLMVQNRKFSGNAVYTEEEIVCQHGTILVDSNIEKMTYFLTPEQSKLDKNHVSSVSSRVINLSEVFRGISIECLKRSMIKAAWAEELKCEQDTQEISKLIQFYSSREWIYGGFR